MNILMIGVGVRSVPTVKIAQERYAVGGGCLNEIYEAKDDRIDAVGNKADLKYNSNLLGSKSKKE